MPEAFGVFVLPPSEDTLLERLRSRGRGGRGDDRTSIRRGSKRDGDGRSGMWIYDAFIVNDDLERAVAELIEVVGADSVRPQRRKRR